MAEDLLGKKVLVVDDSSTSRQILEEMLQALDFGVTCAASGEAALNVLKEAPQERPYDIVITDWKMPDMDGIEISRRIREMSDLPKQPKIILVTAYDRGEATQQVTQAGLDSLLIKPVSESSLFDAIMQAFGKADAVRLVAASEDRAAEMVQPIRGAHILLVEDNEINQQVAQEILEGAGLRVSIAENGQEALDKVKAQEFDAVLMDIQMPVMDGYTATQEIRKWEQQATSDQEPATRLPIIAMTASAMTQDREEATAAGMDDHVSKPIDIDELFSALLKYIEPGEREVPEPLAAQVEETPQEKPLTDMPGISVTEGLARVGGNTKLYMKILTKFYNDYGDATAQIKAALEKDDHELAQRLAHTVKGVGGNIGARDLTGPAGELEAAIKHQKTDGIDDLLVDFADALNMVITSLKNVVEVEAKTEKEKVESKTGDPQELFELLQELEPHLKKRKPKPCKEVMAEIKGINWPAEFNQELSQLEKLIGKYKFKNALPIHESLVEKIKAAGY